MRPIWALIAATLWSSVASSRRLRSSERPLGSPIIPVAPPARAIGEVAGVLEPAQHDQADQVAVVQAVGRRVAPVVEGQRSLPRRQPGRQRGPVGRFLDEAAGLEVGEQVHSGDHVGTGGQQLHRPSSRGTTTVRPCPRPPATSRPTRWPTTPPAAPGCSPSSPGAPRPRAPLYARLAAGIAGDESIAGLLLHAPPRQRQPVLFLACVHDLLLGPAGQDEQLARWYPNLTGRPATGDPLPGAAGVLRRAPGRAGGAAGDAQHADQRDRALRPAAAGVRDARRRGRAARPPRRRHQRRAQPAARPLPLHVRARRRGRRRRRRSTSSAGPGATSRCRRRCPRSSSAGGSTARRSTSTTPTSAAGWRPACGPTRPTGSSGCGRRWSWPPRRPCEITTGDAVADTPRLARELVAHPVITNTWVLNYLSAAPSAPPTSPPSTSWAGRSTSRGSSPRAPSSCPSCPSPTADRPRPPSSSSAGAPAGAPSTTSATPTPTATGCTGT